LKEDEEERLKKENPERFQKIQTDPGARAVWITEIAKNLHQFIQQHRNQKTIVAQIKKEIKATDMDIEKQVGWISKRKGELEGEIRKKRTKRTKQKKSTDYEK